VRDPRAEALRDGWLRTGLWVVLCALILHLAAAAYVRLDFTADGRYALSDGARAIVAKLDRPLVARVYFTAELDPPYHAHRQALLDLLAELDAASGGRIEVVAKDPSADPEVAQEALSYGVHGLPYAFRSADRTETRTVWLGLALLYGERHVAIDALPVVERMEYEVVRAIASLEADPKDRKVVGWWTGHGEPDPSSASGESPLKDLWSRLGERASTRVLTGPIPDDVDLLVIAAPREPVSSEDQAALDRFVLRGGRILAFLSSFQPDFDRGQPVESDHGLHAWLGRHGVVLGKDLLLDRQHEERLGVPIGGRWVQLPHPLAPSTTDLDRTIPAVRGLAKLVLPFASSVRPADPPPDGIEAEVWASTDPDSAAIKGLRTLDPTVVQRGKLSSEVAGPHPVVTALSGAFPADDGSRGRPARLVVVGSADAVANDPELVLNAVDWLVEDPVLIGLRSRMTGDPVLPKPSSATLLRAKLLLVALPLAALAAVGVWVGRRR
jgi:ABC-type uncharacterized transport system involved in gliding motility auxiliary subunit